MESQGEWEVSRLPLPPPVQNHLIQLLAHRFHVGIGESSVQRAHTVRVRTRAADGAVELGLADFAGWALGAVASIAAIVAAWDAEIEMHVAAVEARLHCRRGLGAGLPGPNRRKGSLKRDAFNPADASAITDESRLALPRTRRPQTGRV